MRPGNRVARPCSIAFRAILLAIVLGAAIPALGQTCIFNTGQPASVNFGTINPTLVTTATFSVTVNFKCTGSANATFVIVGLNDSGPGAYRLKHNTQIPAQYMSYSVSTVIIPGTKVTLNGQIVAGNYQNAYVGDYSDSLTITILP